MQTLHRYTMPVVIALFPLLSTSVSAQQETTKPSRNVKNSGMLEEIVVTARKKSESLQDTPLSITALSAEELQRAGATSNYDVALLTPNFSTNQQLGRRLDRPVIRGQSGAAVGGEPNASYFIDGVFVSGSISSATLGPVERVEIIRGPQSAQFGRATFAGAVNYITRKPTNDFEGEVRVIRATNDTTQINGWTSGPIVNDKLQYFIAAGYDTYGGEWYNSLGNNQADPTDFINPPQYGDSSKLGGTETKEFTGKLLWAATDSTDITLKLGYTKNNDDHYAQFILEPGELNCYLPTAANMNETWYNTSQGAYCGEINFDHVTYNPSNPIAGPYIPGAPLNGEQRQARFNLPDFRQGMTYILPNDPTYNAAPISPGGEREQKRSLLEIDQGLGDWNVIARAAYNSDDYLTAYDLDQRETRPIGGVFTVVEQRDIKDKSFELILNTPIDWRLRGSLGSYFFNSDLEQSQRRFVGYSCFGPGCGLAQFEDPLVTKIENRSVFGTIDFDILDNLTFSVEARYAKDEKTISSPYSCNGQPVNDKAKSDALTPRFILDWQTTDDVMFYILASKGNKPAEFNSTYFRVTATPCASLQAREEGLTQTKEETAWTYEGGTKTTWLDGRALLNLSVFWIEWQNQTTFITIEQPNGLIDNALANAGRSEVFGLEFESSFAFTERFVGSLSYGLADAKYKRFNSDMLAYTTGVGLITTPGPAQGQVDPNANNAGGNAIPFSPKHSVIGSLSYNRDINAQLGWFARTDAVWESKKYTGAANLLVLPSRTVWNGRLGLETDSWTLTS